jgi:hypothetical protein
MHTMSMDEQVLDSPMDLYPRPADAIATAVWPALRDYTSVRSSIKTSSGWSISCCIMRATGPLTSNFTGSPSGQWLCPSQPP